MHVKHSSRCPQDMRVQDAGDEEEAGSSGQGSSKDIIDVEGFGYNENGSIIFDGGSYSTGPEFIGAQALPAGAETAAVPRLLSVAWMHLLCCCCCAAARGCTCCAAAAQLHVDARMRHSALSAGKGPVQ
jgi:hypothetical protein